MDPVDTKAYHVLNNLSIKELKEYISALKIINSPKYRWMDSEISKDLNVGSRIELAEGILEEKIKSIE